MECELLGGSLRYFEALGTITCTQENTAELIVPDALPDVRDVFDACGQSFLRSKEVRRGSVVVAGVSELTVLVQPEDGGALRPLRVDIPFEAEQACPGLADGDRLMAQVRLLGGEGRMLNSRKLLVRAEVLVTVFAYSQRELRWCRELKAADCQVEQLSQTLTLLPVTEVTERVFELEETVPLPAGRPAVEALLCARAVLNQEEGSIVGSKLILRGSAELHVSYLASGDRLAAASFRLPWSAVLETEGQEGSVFQICPALTGCCLSQSESGGFVVKLGAVAQAALRSPQELTQVRDAYGIDCTLTLGSETRSLPVRVTGSTRTETLDLRLESGKPVNSIVELSAVCGRTRSEGGQLCIPVSVKAVCLAEEEPVLLSRSGEVRCEGSGVPELHIGELYASVSGRGVDLRLPVELGLTVMEELPVTVLTSAEAEQAPPAPRAAVTLQRVRPGDSVWSLGKEKSIPCASILAYNDLDPERELEPGALLLLAR